MKITILPVILSLFSIPLFAQDEKGLLSGKVTDSLGLPLPHVSIQLRETLQRTATDEKGNYYLKVPVGNYHLTAELLGYKNREVSINVSDKVNINIPFVLMEQPQVMKEVIISGLRIKSTSAMRSVMQIKDIPQSVIIMGQKTIREQAAFDLTTIARNISGLNFTGNYGGAGSYQFFNARGFDLNDSQNYRWNGAMIWNLGNNYWDNIEQVEFIKGPTSILFGDVAPGGVLNFVTKKPLAGFMANINLKTGSWGLLRPSLDLTGSITKDHTLRYRINTSYEKSNSFRDYVSSEKQLIAPSIAWDISPQLSLTFETVFKKSSATDDAGLVSPDGTIKGLDSLDPSLYLGEPSRKFLFNDQSYYATLNYEINKRWRLRTIGFYADTKIRPFGLWFDQPDVTGDFVRRTYGYHQKAKNRTNSVDVQGTFFTGAVKHIILVGADLQSTKYAYTNGGTLSEFDTNNIFNLVYGQTATQEPVSEPFSPFTSKISRQAVYLQDQAMLFNEKFHVLFGLRAGSTQQGNNYDEALLEGSGYEGYTDNIISKRVLTPRFGLIYKPRAWHSIYASWSEGYEVNSPDIFAQNYQDYASPPATTSTQLEFGSKVTWFKGKLDLTISTFEINKLHPYGYVYLDPVNPNYDEYAVYYQGHHRSKGLEFDIDGKILPMFSITAGAAYTKTSVMEDPGYPKGNLLPNAPKITANFWLSYAPLKILKGLSLGTGLFFKDKFFSGISNNPDFEIPASYTLDVACGYQYKKASIQFNMMNVTNQVSYLNPWQFNLFDVKPLRQGILTFNYLINSKDR